MLAAWAVVSLDDVSLGDMPAAVGAVSRVCDLGTHRRSCPGGITVRVQSSRLNRFLTT
jgi:hypothetical protein